MSAPGNAAEADILGAVSQVDAALAASRESSATDSTIIASAAVHEDPAVQEAEQNITEATKDGELAPKTNGFTVEQEQGLEETVQIPEDDVLGSSLFNAFSLPPPKITTPEPTESDIPPKPAAALPDNSSPQSSNTLAVGPDGSPSTNRIEYEKVDWRPEYDERLKHWRAENKAASEKALKKREEWAEIRKREAAEAKAAAAKAAKVEPKVIVEQEAQAKAGSAAVGEGIAKELGVDEQTALGTAVKGVPTHTEGEDEERWKRVGEAWKRVDEPKPTTEADVKIVNGEKVETVDPAVAADPSPAKSTPFAESAEPSSSQEPKSAPAPAPTAEKGADISPSAPADLPIEAYLTGSSSLNPPSLTLALFSSKYLPPRRRFLLGLACLGVNVLLPFIGGMMAGFGELAAKNIQTLVRDSFFHRSLGTSGVGLGAGRNETAAQAAERTAAEHNPLRSAFP